MGRRHTPFQKILVGFDGSSQSEKAIDAALSLAQDLDSRVIVFSVARPSEPSAREPKAVLDEAKEHFEKHFNRIGIRAHSLGVELEIAIGVGHPVEQIVHRAETDRIDLIILGHRGVSRFERLLVGSTSEKVIRYAHCPVLIVR